MIKQTIKKYFYYIIGIIFITIIEALIILSLPDYMANIISYGIGENNLNYIYITGIKMILITFLSAICAITSSYLTSRLGAFYASDLRLAIYKKITYMDENIFNKFTKASLLTRTTNDINQICNVISNFVKMILFAVIIGAGGIIKAITKSKGIPILTIILILGILLVIFFLIIIFFLVVRRFETLQTILDKINSKTKEILGGTLVIRAFNKEKIEEQNFKKINEEYNNLEYFLNKIMALLNPYMNFVMNGVIVTIMYFITKKALSIEDIGNMLAFNQYATQVISSFLTLSIIFILLPKAKVSLTRINEILNTKNELIENKQIPFKGLKNCIEFKNVSFHYQNSEENALNNIRIKFEKGKTYGIIGSTASGKTTLVNLICHLYDPTEGNILIDGIDIQDINKNDLLKEISYIPKNSSLFKGTIKENILDGNSKATDKEIKNALKSACANFIKDLNEEISENGINFSGGEKQRISIARGLIKNSSILIIDDALSALDYKTDSNVRKNIAKIYKNKTQIIISSRIATIMNSDKIIVLENGNLIAFDNHENLINTCDIYKEIVLSQLGMEGVINE